jgi:hypothetical protein
MRVNKTAGRLVLDSLGTATFTFGTLDLTDDVLETPTSLTVTTGVIGTGGFALTGTGTQTLTLPAVAVTPRSLYLEKPSGTVAVASPTVFGATVRNVGTARLVGDVAIAATGTLDLAGGTLTLSRDLDVSGVLGASGGDVATAGFTLRLAPTVADGQVVRLAAVAGDGSALTSDVLFERPHLDGEGWRMIAAPFAAPFQSLNDDFHTQGAPGATYPFGGAHLFSWDPEAPPAERYVAVPDFAAAMEPGRGYFFKAYGTAPGTGAPLLPTVWDVLGREPAGEIVSLLSYSTPDSGRRYNLLGNPYAAPVDWHAVQAGGRFTATYAIWDPADSGGTGTYAYYSTAGVSTGRASRYIGPTQGFWAESTISSPFGLTWNRAWKVPTATPTTAGRGDGTPQLRFRLEGEGLTATEPVALFLDGAADGADDFDATWFVPLSSDYAALFFVRPDDGAALVFEARPAPSRPLHLAVETTRAGAYTLSWPDLDLAPPGPVLLVDSRTGSQVDLRSDSLYTFTVDAGAPTRALAELPGLRAAEGDARFMVSFGAATAVDEASGVSVVTLEGARPNPSVGRTTLRFALPDAQTVRLSVVDLLGRTVVVAADGHRGAGWHDVLLDTSPLASGVYVVRLDATGGTRTTRLTVAR